MNTGQKHHSAWTHTRTRTPHPHAHIHTYAHTHAHTHTHVHTHTHTHAHKSQPVISAASGRIMGRQLILIKNYTLSLFKKL
jgi:hypothetical protein